MLRQLFRTRGACNVVNLPVASTQDDPGPNQGRADYSADWRRQYNPAYAEPEFREDVGRGLPFSPASALTAPVHPLAVVAITPLEMQESLSQEILRWRWFLSCPWSRV